MDISQILMYAFQTIITILIGIAGWSMKNSVSELKDAIKCNRDEIAKVKNDLADLKSDLPLVYVLREDFIRVMNNVDNKLDKLLTHNNANHNSKEG